MLEAQLPSAAAVQVADEQASALRQQLADADARYREAWPRFLALLHECEVVARELARAQRDAHVRRAQLTDLTQQYALATPVPAAGLKRSDGALAGHLATVLMHVAHGDEPDETTELYLRGLRAAATA